MKPSGSTIALRSEQEVPQSSGSAVAQVTGAWHVLYVKSRQEKALGSDLERLGISFYLPLISKVTCYGSRRFRVQLPLFPGYMFLQGTRDDVIQADRTRRLVRSLPVVDQRQLGWELDNIRLALQRGADLGSYRPIQNGSRVYVKSGPFQGLQGIVENHAQANRLVLQVEMLGQAVSMEIDRDLLEVLALP